MNDPTDKQKLWKIYGILMGVMVGGAVLILGGQAAWNAIQENISKASSENKPPSTNSVPLSTPQAPPEVRPQPNSQPATSNSLTKQEAVNLIERYLQAKDKIFAAPFDRQLAANLTTGKVYDDIIKPGGSIDWLQQNNAYYQYSNRSAQATGYFSASGNEAQIEVAIKEDFSFYMNGSLDESKTNSGFYRFTLKLENANWKIADRQVKN
ncbi:ARC6/PARC6 family protein [Microcoleus sp. N9_B2]|uniref:ARC6/PARC6 family protein n=1 Tax=unclassified Microcoleus TaxID=2642155 RepID=UPI002FD07C97